MKLGRSSVDTPRPPPPARPMQPLRSPTQPIGTHSRQGCIVKCQVDTFAATGGVSAPAALPSLNYPPAYRIYFFRWGSNKRISLIWVASRAKTIDKLEHLRIPFIYLTSMSLTSMSLTRTLFDLNEHGQITLSRLSWNKFTSNVV